MTRKLARPSHVPLSWLLHSVPLRRAARLGAAAAPAQDASRDAVGDYRIRVVEPTEGFGVTAEHLRVTVELDGRPRVWRRSSGRARHADAAAPNRPVRRRRCARRHAVRSEDGRDRGLAPGAHTLLVTATDTNDAVVDRKEVHFTVLPPPPA
jgi:hypothetical protein